MRFSKLYVARPTAKRETSWLSRILSLNCFFNRWCYKRHSETSSIQPLLKRNRHFGYPVCFERRWQPGRLTLDWAGLSEVLSWIARAYPLVPTFCHSSRLDRAFPGWALVVECYLQLRDRINRSCSWRTFASTDWEKGVLTNSGLFEVSCTSCWTILNLSLVGIAWPPMSMIATCIPWLYTLKKRVWFLPIMTSSRRMVIPPI